MTTLPTRPGWNSRAPLARVDPSAKLLALTAVSLSLLMFFDPWTPGALYLVMLLVVSLGARVSWRVTVLAHLPLLAFGVGTFWVNALTRDGVAVWSVGPFEATDDGLRVGAALALRTLAVGMGVLAFVATTTPPDLVGSLRAQLRLPTRLAYAILAGYRVLQELPDQWMSLRRSHAVRRPDPRTALTGRLPLTPGLAWRAARGLLVVALRQGERLAITMETRGLGTGPRTAWHPVPLRRSDLWFFLGCVATLGVIAAATTVLGVAVGPIEVNR